jgi:O-antigen ligase
VFLRNPILGVGIGDVQDESVKEYIRDNNTEAYTNKYNAHNDWLQILLTTGTVGFVLFLNFFLRLVKKAWVSKDLYMISFVIFYVVVSMTESILERNKGILFFSFFITFFFILKKPGEPLFDTLYKKTTQA